MTLVAEEGAKPSPSPTKTLDAQSSKSELYAAGGPAKVPRDQKATPASRTTAPPILQHPLHQSSKSIQACSEGGKTQSLS